MGFTKLKIHPEILKAIHEMGYIVPTEIQEKTIPFIQEGQDVIGQSKTGSGKTAAFGLPLLEKIERRGQIQLLVLAPTRELAHQIDEEFRKYSKYFKKSFIALIYGGASLDRQAQELTRADIVIGTPGRILDHMRRGNMKLGNVKFVVIDEADRMFDMGFIDDVNTILGQTNKERQTMLFSATFPDEINRLIHRYMKNPKTVKVKSLLDMSVIKECYYAVEQHEKFSLLVHLLNAENAEKALVFCGTRHTAELVARNLEKNKFNAELIHGGLSHNKRIAMIDLFKKGKLHILVATDVAARGLDINEVTHVINYDVPMRAEDYIHRIGRTARAGKHGKAITIVGPKDHDAFRPIEAQFREKLEPMHVENLQRIPFSVGERGGDGDRRGGGRGGPRRFGGGRPQRGGGRGEGRGGYGERSESGERSGGYGNRDGASRGFSRGPRRFGGNRSGGNFGRGEGREDNRARYNINN